MGLESKIRTGAMISGAISAHRVSQAQQQSARAQQAQAVAHHQEAMAQMAQAEQMARAASAAEHQAMIAAQAAAHQRQLQEQAAAQALRAQFAQWRQTPDGRAYEQWKRRALELSEDLLARTLPAVNFQPQLAAAHAFDVERAHTAYPDLAEIVPQPEERLIASPRSRSVIIAAVAIGLIVIAPVLSGVFNGLARVFGLYSSSVEALSTLCALVVAAAVCFFGVRWVRRSRVAKADQARLAAGAEYETAVGRWRDWQAQVAAAKAARRTFLAGASDNPHDAPQWWQASASDGGFLPTPQQIEAFEAHAMRQFPAPHELPTLQRASFRVFDSVAAGPEVQKALAWYRSHNPTRS
jgi:hypothetical protein